MKKSRAKIKKIIGQKINNDKPFTILFVCSGNSCRSPMAKGIMDKIIQNYLKESQQRVKIMTLSAGTVAPNGQLPTANAQKAALEYGADIHHHLSAPLTMERIKMADLILAMQEKHKIAILELVPEVKNKTFIITEYINQNKLGIDDPLSHSFEKYQETAKELYELLLKIYKKIIKKINQKNFSPQRHRATGDSQRFISFFLCVFVSLWYILY